MLGVQCCIGVEISTNAGSGYIASFYDGDNGRLVDLSAYPTAKYWYAYLRIYEGVNVDGITIYPMIRPSDISNADFESYKPSIADYISIGFKEYSRRKCEMSIGVWECIDMELFIP